MALTPNIHHAQIFDSWDDADIEITGRGMGDIETVEAVGEDDDTLRLYDTGGRQ